MEVYVAPGSQGFRINAAASQFSILQHVYREVLTALEQNAQVTIEKLSDG